MIPGVGDAPTRQTLVTRKAKAISELSINQRESYKEEMATFNLDESYVDRIGKGMMTIRSAMMKSAKDHIPSSF